VFASPGGVGEPGEEPVRLTQVSERGAVQHPEHAVESEPELGWLDAPTFGHDKPSGLVEDVVPGERSRLSLRSGPPHEPQG
jgi:hypothetical protein